MKPYQEKFIEFIIEKSIIKFGDFILKSGKESNYFINFGLINEAKDLDILSNFYIEAILENGIESDTIFGPAYKGIPIACCTSINLSKKLDKSIRFVYNRKEVKDHGEGGNLIGEIKGKILLVDDVITAGTAIKQSLHLLKVDGYVVDSVLVAIDRHDRNDPVSPIDEIQKDFGVDVFSIVCITDIIEYIKNNHDKEYIGNNITRYLK